MAVSRRCSRRDADFRRDLEVLRFKVYIMISECVF